MEADQLEPITRMVKLIADYGILLAISAIVLVFGTWFCWVVVSIVRKYGPKIAEAHLAFLKNTTECNATNAKANTENATASTATAATLKAVSDTLVLLTDSVGTKLDPKGDPKYNEHIFSNVSTKLALKSALIATKEAIESGDPKDALPGVERAIDELGI